MAVRPDLLRDVWQSLQFHNYLSQEDFAIQEYEDNAGHPALRIQYRYDTAFFFAFRIPTQRQADSYRFAITAQPGYESTAESLNVDSRSALKSELREWLDRLYDDVVALPIGRQLAEHGHAINELRERLVVLPDEPMSQADVEAFNEGLEKLKSEISGQLAKEAANTQDLESKVAELTRDIDFLKSTLDTMHKRQWGELLLARVNQWRTRFSLRQIASGSTKVLRLLMPGDASLDILDSVAQESDLADTVEEPAEGEGVDE